MLSSRPVVAVRISRKWPVRSRIAIAAGMFLLVNVLHSSPCFAQQTASARHTHSHSTAHATTRHTSSHHISGHRAGPANPRHAHTRRHVSARTLAHVHQLQRAFIASSQLRPMAQQLNALRTPEAYSGVRHYAQTHSGEAAAAAYLSLGHAYAEDQKYAEAASSFQQANRAGQALDDYADYLGAQAESSRQNYISAQQLLEGFGQRHPDSILIDQSALLLAQGKLAQGDPQAALKLLVTLQGNAIAKSSSYLFALAKANQLAGNRVLAQQIYTRIYVDDPLSTESGQVGAQLQQMGVSPTFTVAESMRHADGLYLAGRYAAAAADYQTLAHEPSIAGTPKVNDLLARAAVAAFKQSHHVDVSQLAQLSDTNDEAGATRLYLSLEAARDKNDTQQVKALIDQLELRFPNSRWTTEALLSAGNMALVANDMPLAIRYYGDLATRFPDSSLAPASHWHAAWLNYRLGDKKIAAQLFDEQIARYPTDTHASTALYWRGVIYQEVEHNPAAAAAYYQKLVDDFQHYYYAGLARQRLAAIGAVVPAVMPQLAVVPSPQLPELTEQVPEDDIHVERAKLLANAGLNQYIVAEISASQDSASWGAYAEAQIYSSYGESWRAMHLLKDKVHSYFAVPITAIPRNYWSLLFPQPYWPVLERESQKRSLDPFLVASLIRQESEFNPSVVSYANAWGLMQMLPSVGNELARKEHVRPFRTSYLLNPEVNLELGTAYFRELMDEFQGQPEYALAAYNAGDNRVKAWLANGPYASLPEFVESIPFTQTREYVQAIMRNRDIYRQLYDKK